MPIIVNDVEITDDEVHAEMQYHRADSLQAARHEAARALVIRHLLLQAAREADLLGDADIADAKKVEEKIDVLLAREVCVPEADESSCRYYYESNLERFVDRKTRAQLPFEKVEEHIRKYLYTRSLKTGISQYIRLLAGRARIVGFDMEGSDSPLVQ